MGIQLGIIGYGGMGGFHHRNASKIEGVQVVGAYDIDPVRVQVAEKNGIKGFSTLEDLLSCDEINTVLVAVPNDKHMELCVEAANAGKHVICEKPAAMNVRELDQMIAAAGRNGKIFTVHQNRRWDKDFRIVKKILDSGELGKVYSIQSRLHGSGGVMFGWRGEKKHGGGMLYDWGVHFIDQLMWMLGYNNFKSVFCKTYHVKTTEVEDYFFLVFDLEDGRHVQVEIGTFVLKELPRWVLLGDEATAYVNDFSRSGGIIRLDNTAETKSEIIMTSAGPTRTFAPRPDNVKLESELPEVQADWSEYYKNVRDAIDGKAELIVQPWQVRKVLKVIEAAFQSAETGNLVSLRD